MESVLKERLRFNLMNYLITFFMSMLPIVELRGAVPYGVAHGIPFWLALTIGVIGSMAPVPFIFFFARKVLVWGADKAYIGKFFTWCLQKGHNAGQKLEKFAGEKWVLFALFLYVGIPIPGSGAWSGILAASFLDLNFKHSVVAVMLGTILAGLITGTLTILLGASAL